MALFGSSYFQTFGANTAIANVLGDGPGIAWDFQNNACLVRGVGTDYNGTISGSAFAVGDTHAQAIWAPNAVEEYSSFATDVPVRTTQGLQSNLTQTQYCPRSDWTGFVAPSTIPNGGIETAAAVTTSFTKGTEDGLEYIELTVTGTATAGQTWQYYHGATPVGSVVQNDTMAYSVFFKNTGANLSPMFNYIVFGSNQLDAAGVYIANISSAVGDSDLTLASTNRRRLEMTGVADNASVSRINWSIFGDFIGGAVDFSFRLYAPQIEKNTFTGPVVKNSGDTAVTTNGTNQVVSGLGTLLVSGVAGIIQLDAKILGASGIRVFSLDDGTSDNRVQITWDSGSVGLVVTAGGVSQSSVNVIATQGPIGLCTIAFAVSANYAQARMVGQSAPSPDTSITWPVVTSLGLGGVSYQIVNNNYQYTKKLVLKFGSQSQSTFDAMYSLAVANSLVPEVVRSILEMTNSSIATNKMLTISAPVVGNRLLLYTGIEKDSGAINVPTDNGTGAWVQIGTSSISGDGASGAIFTKISSGTETQITASWTNTRGATLAFVELTKANVVGKFGIAISNITTADNTSGVISTSAIDSGPQLAIAFCHADSASSTDASITHGWNNYFTEIDSIGMSAVDYVESGSRPSASIGTRYFYATETPTTEFTWAWDGGIADEAMGILVTVKP